MHLGDIELRHIHGGHFFLDGGAMFGVVPKPLWEKKSAPDSRNRIKLAANSLLLRVKGKNVLIETGNGTKWTPKLRDIYGVEDGDPLVASLHRAGVAPQEIDLVINTHLHFDHAGGNTKFHDGKIVAAFPRAQYVVQAGELAHAENPSERDRASYFAENFAPLHASGQWDAIEGDAEILPGVSAVRIPGHNADIQAIRISGGGKTVFFVADLFPTRHHLALPWIMAYDLYPLQTLETKRKWLQAIVQQNWIVVFGHDSEVPAATLQERDSRIEFEPAGLDG
ncbi:MAG TPA: MBL fold metallo-hydrolase [Dongiaceae bacterium]|nr:MBL fold metallo-hydrolase [Dongiaceae bacterium]